MGLEYKGGFSMTSVNLKIPQEVKMVLLAQSKNKGFKSLSDYIRSILVKEVEK